MGFEVPMVPLLAGLQFQWMSRAMSSRSSVKGKTSTP